MITKRIIIIFVCFIIPCSLFAEKGSIRIDGWRVNYTDKEMKDGNYVLKSPTVELYSLMGFGILEFPYIVIDDRDDLVDCGEGSKEVEMLSTNGISIKAKNYQFSSQGLMLSGELNLNVKGSDGTTLSIPEKIIYLDENGRAHIYYSLPEDFSIILFGFKVNAKLIQTGVRVNFDHSSTFSLFDASLVIPGSDNTIMFETLHFYADGELVENPAGTIKGIFEIEGKKLGITECTFVDDKLICKGFLEKENGDSVYRERIVLTKEGEFLIR
ncbi:MAG: hypothetical protein JW904_05345 [Spirochaetales bacterium]|nr:hypothetical protein [Spirochaetales bacterium]